MIKKVLGAALREKRTKAGLSQEKLAIKSGVTLRYYQDIERGNKQPSVTTVFKLAEGLGVSPASILADAWKEFQKGNRGK